MANGAPEDIGRNVVRQLEEIRQILPTLAMKEELRTLATKEDLRTLATKEELRTLATKEDLRTLATKEELRTLATKEELLATREELLATKAELRGEITALREEMREEGKTTRRHFDVVAEGMRTEIRMLAEGILANQQRIDAVRTELKGEVAGLDHRVTRLEAARRPRR